MVQGKVSAVLDLKIYRNIKYGRKREANTNLLDCSFHLPPHMPLPLLKKKQGKKLRMELIFEKQPFMRDKKCRKIMGTRMKECDVLWHRSDTFHGKTKERKDRRVISHQTGKLSASRAEAAVKQQPYRDFS